MGRTTSIETTERGLEATKEVQEMSPGSCWALSHRHQWHLASTWNTFAQQDFWALNLDALAGLCRHTGEGCRCCHCHQTCLWLGGTLKVGHVPFHHCWRGKDPNATSWQSLHSGPSLSLRCAKYRLDHLGALFQPSGSNHSTNPSQDQALPNTLTAITKHGGFSCNWTKIK